MIRVNQDSIPYGQIIMKIVQLITLFTAAVLAGAWSSKGVSFTDLDEEPLFTYLIIMCVFGMVWSIVSLIILPFKQDFPPIVVIIVTSVLTVLLIIAASLFVWGVDTIAQSSLVGALDLNIAALEAACFFAVVGVMAYIGDIVLEVISMIFRARSLGVKKLFLGSCCD